MLNYTDVFRKTKRVRVGPGHRPSLVQLVFIVLYGEIRDTRVYIFPVLLHIPCVPGFPQQTAAR